MDTRSHTECRYNGTNVRHFDSLSLPVGNLSVIFLSNLFYICRRVRFDSRNLNCYNKIVRITITFLLPSKMLMYIKMIMYVIECPNNAPMVNNIGISLTHSILNMVRGKIFSFDLVSPQFNVSVLVSSLSSD